MKIIIITLACATLCFGQTVETPRAWLTFYDHSKIQTVKLETISSDPCYTNIISDYKPVVRKVGERWEIVFVSEIAERLP